MLPKIIPIGTRFERLIVLKYAGVKDRKALWKCRCDCGNTTIVQGKKLRNGHTRSCGCLQRERAAEVHTKHSMSNIPEYKIWKEMKRRCSVETAKGYQNYGGRGIKVCESWKRSFESFYSDMGERPSAQYSLGRIDNDKGYVANNCQWEKIKQQANNKRTSNLVTLEVTLTLTQWCDLLNISKPTIKSRVAKGLSVRDALMGDPAFIKLYDRVCEI